MGINLTFLGTGEAFDPDRTATSYLIQHSEIGKPKYSLMVDCGYDAPKSLMRLLANQKRSLADAPNSVLFTHGHGDHFAGISALLLPMWEEINEAGQTNKEKRKLEILSADETLFQKVRERMESDYPGFLERFKIEGPEISFRKLNSPDRINNMLVSYAQTNHSVPNHAYRFEDKGKALAISGDGSLNEQTKQLFKGVELLVHEGFYIDTKSKTHASIKDVAEFAIDARISNVAIVHVNRVERQKIEEITRIQAMCKKAAVNLFLPNTNEGYYLY